MLEKLKNLEEYYNLLEEKLSDAEIIKPAGMEAIYLGACRPFRDGGDVSRLKKVENDLREAGNCSRKSLRKRWSFLKEETDSLNGKLAGEELECCCFLIQRRQRCCY